MIRRRLGTLLLALTAGLLLCVPLSGIVRAYSGPGSGTSGDPYLIFNCVQLQEMQDNVTAHYQLAAEVDCSDTVNWNGGKGFLPVGDTSQFTGSLDGNGFKIEHLTIVRADDDPGNAAGDETFVGLFGRTNNATITNVHLEHARIKGYSIVGGLAGQMAGGTIEDSSVNVGESNDNDCSEEPCVQAPYGQYQGGLVGFMIGGAIEGSLTGGPVTGYAVRAGGLVGNMESGATVTSSYSRSRVVGGAYVGGLIGDIEDSSAVSEAFATGSVEASDDSGGAGQYAGGLAGYIQNSTVSHAWAVGDVRVDKYNGGGFAGEMASGTVTDAFATGNVTSGESYIGGFIGTIYGGTVERTYASGDVSIDIAGAERAGGFSSEVVETGTPVAIRNSFATGAVSAPSGMGGFIALYPDNGEELTNNYYDVTRTGQAVCTADGNVSGCTGVNTANAAPTYFFDSETNDPLDTWDFSSSGVWHDNYNDYPTLTPVPPQQQMLCEQPQSTTTTITARCGYRPYGWGTTTWEAAYQKAGDTAWVPLTLVDIHDAAATVSGLQPNTQYYLRFRPTNDDPTFHDWGVVWITTKAALVVNVPAAIHTSSLANPATDLIAMLTTHESFVPADVENSAPAASSVPAGTSLQVSAADSATTTSATTTPGAGFPFWVLAAVPLALAGLFIRSIRKRLSGSS